MLVSLCAGFSTKEIGVVTQTDKCTIYVRKTSIRKKINAGEERDCGVRKRHLDRKRPD